MVQALRRIALVSVFLAPGLSAQTTRAERTDYRQTSTYADVVAFLDSLQTITPDLRLGTIATSPEGRAVPYVIASRPLVSSPAEAQRWVSR